MLLTTIDCTSWNFHDFAPSRIAPESTRGTQAESFLCRAYEAQGFGLVKSPSRGTHIFLLYVSPTLTIGCRLPVLSIMKPPVF